MSLNGYPHKPGVSFVEYIDASLAKMWTDAQLEFNRDEVEVNIRVTDLTDDQVETVRQRASTQGFAQLVLVDDQEPPRPGTVRSAGLQPYAGAVIDQATQARRAAARRSATDFGSGSASTKLL